LFQPLRVAVDTAILAHEVANGFDDSGEIFLIKN